MDWLTRSGRARLVVPAVLVAMAVVTMVVGVGTPDRIFFDEVYYANDARDFLAFGVEDGFVVHPPLAKLLIAVGIWVFGDTPFGWRIAGAVLGASAVLVTYLLARRLGLRLGAAALAGVVVAWDGIWIAQSRTAMLDIFLGFFVVLGAYALVRDLEVTRVADDLALAEARAHATPPPPSELPRVVAHAVTGADDSTVVRPDHGQRDVVDDAHDPWPADVAPGPRDPGAPDDPHDPHDHDDDAPLDDPDGDAPAADEPPPAPPVGPPTRVHADLPRLRLRDRGWLLLAGVSFGAATASKWSGAIALLAAALVWGVAELVRRHRVTGGFGRRLPGAVLLGVVALGLVPVAAYAASWIPWYAAFDNAWIAETHCGDEGDELECDGFVGRTEALVSYHERMLGFHDGLEAEHAYRAPAWGWPIQLRPVVYYYETCSEARQAREERTDDEGEVSTPEPCRVEPGQAAEILSLGNPASWWGLLVLLPLVGLLAARRDRRMLVPLAFYALQFGFWVGVLPLVALLSDGSNVTRPMFNFYLVPVVPFLAVMLAVVVDRITARDAWIRASLFGFGAAAVVALGTWVADLLGPGLLEPVRWYLVGATALLGGAVAALDAPDPPPRETPPRTWPTAVAIVLVVAMGLWFLPLWTGIALPEDLIKAHWWLPTWV